MEDRRSFWLSREGFVRVICRATTSGNVQMNCSGWALPPRPPRGHFIGATSCTGECGPDRNNRRTESSVGGTRRNASSIPFSICRWRGDEAAAPTCLPVWFIAQSALTANGFVFALAHRSTAYVHIDHAPSPCPSENLLSNPSFSALETAAIHLHPLTLRKSWGFTIARRGHWRCVQISKERSLRWDFWSIRWRKGWRSDPSTTFVITDASIGSARYFFFFFFFALLLYDRLYDDIDADLYTSIWIWNRCNNR